MYDEIETEEIIGKWLPGRYFLPVQAGTLRLELDEAFPELWLENSFGAFRLFPKDEEALRQLYLPFDFFFDPLAFAGEMESVFVKTLSILGRFSTDRQALATYCLRYKDRAIDLVEDCPWLAYLLATEHYYRFTTCGDAGDLSPDGKRTRLLQKVGLPPSKSLTRVFRKVPAAECSMEFLFDLKQLLRQEDPRVYKILCHMKRVNHLLVRVLRMGELLPHLSWSLLAEVSAMSVGDDREKHFRQMADIKDSLTEAIGEGIRVPLLLSLADLDGLHDDIIHWLRDGRRFIRIKDYNFPSPPLPGYERKARDGRVSTIIPIETGAALWHEGGRMHHCVAGLAEMLRDEAGNKYVYHLELADGELATLLIVINDGKWEVEQIQGPCNSKVSLKMMSFVIGWLEKHRQKPVPEEPGADPEVNG